jgi:hypothetical protein
MLQCEDFLAQMSPKHGKPRPCFELARSLSVNQSIMLGIDALFLCSRVPIVVPMLCPNTMLQGLDTCLCIFQVPSNAEWFPNADEREQKPDKERNNKRKS